MSATPEEKLAAAREANEPAPAKEEPVRLLTLSELRAMPPTAYLVDRTVPEAGMTVLFGPSGHGKTFVALDLALSVATGQRWHGALVKQGGVVLLALEGGGGLAKRIDAWLASRGIVRDPPVRVVRDGLNLFREGEERLVQAIRAESFDPRLVVVDTFARAFAGSDENLQRDVGAIVECVDRLARTLECAVVLVHHTGHAGDRERGGSGLPAAADARISVAKDEASKRLLETRVKVEVRKLKDDEEPAPKWLVARQVVLDDGCTSVVLDADDRQVDRWAVAKDEAKVAEVLELLADGVPRSKNKIAQEVRGARQAVLDLVERLAADGDLVRVEARRGHEYTLPAPPPTLLGV